MRRWGIFGSLLLLAAACASTRWQAKLADPARPEEIDATAPFLKVHMKDGRVVVLRHWEVAAGSGQVLGSGFAWDASRDHRGPLQTHVIPIADVALFETNRPESVAAPEIASFVALGALTTISLSITVACAASPKSCFGSCPTFFADDGAGLALQAEGFSASVARSLEATDVDAMWTARSRGRSLDVLMTNDALETHAVDRVRVLAAPRPAGGRVLREGDRYFAARGLVPARARAPSGDVSAALEATDGVDYRSMASETDLAEKETLELSFPPQAGPRGLLIVGRNSLLNTFLFYQTLAFMGRRAGDFIAALERAGPSAFAGIGRAGSALGDIDVRARQDDGTWRHAGVFSEVGPIAREAELVRLPETRGPVEVELRMTRGNWRIDQVALVAIAGEVHPVAIEPREVLRGGRPDERARGLLRGAGGHLLTYPRDEYLLRFDLPEGDLELFLESRGYYYEWMRREWLADEDATQAAAMFLAPESSLRRLAPRFKRVEAEMEPIFWSSRVTRRP